MKFLILSKTDRAKYRGIARVFSYLGINVSFPDKAIQKDNYALVISDEFCLPMLNRYQNQYIQILLIGVWILFLMDKIQ